MWVAGTSTSGEDRADSRQACVDGAHLPFSPSPRLETACSPTLRKLIAKPKCHGIRLELPERPGAAFGLDAELRRNTQRGQHQEKPKGLRECEFFSCVLRSGLQYFFGSRFRIWELPAQRVLISAAQWQAPDDVTDLARLPKPQSLFAPEMFPSLRRRSSATTPCLRQSRPVPVPGLAFPNAAEWHFLHFDRSCT